MSSKVDAYVIPIDPKNLTSQTGVAPIDVTKFWNTPKPQKSSANSTRVIYEQDRTIGLVSLGDKFSTRSAHGQDEAYRQAVGSGLKQLAKSGAHHIAVAVGERPHAAAVGAHLSSFFFTLKTKHEEPRVESITPTQKLDGRLQKEWENGVIYAQAQNLVRELMELPANILTPTAYCKRIQKEFADIPDTEVIVHDEAWAEEKGMRTFLSVAKGTCEPAKFLEIHYNGAAKEETPLLLVGKGITFDSGGISLKPALDMKLMRSDMGGAATVSATALAIARMKLPINLVVCIPLTENMPGSVPGKGGSANKPGDIVYAMNGKSVEVDNTDAEGRLILADALHYANITWKPKTIIDVATLTGAMEISLGTVFTGVFSSSDSLWEELHAAGEAEHDRFWRMPLDEGFGPQIYSSNADLCNRGGKPGGSCTAALFLKAFVEGVETEDNPGGVRWAHLDIAGTSEVKVEGPYQRKGMTGRGTRGLIEYVKRACITE